MTVRMLSGFNHNIRHDGRVYHVQTEDAGRRSACLVTHVYIGGVILDSVRASYEDLLDDPRFQEKLKDRMKAQHLEAMRRLLAGAIPPPEEESGPDA